MLFKYLWQFDFLRYLRTKKRLRKGLFFLNSSMRPLCSCGLRPVAINYYKGKKPYYRSQCGACLRGVKLPRWKSSGYVMKSICDKCGFRSTHREIFGVFHVDGDLNNCRPTNLKTICANCARVLHKEGIKWRQGDLVPDL